MSEHRAEIRWYRNTESFAYQDYDRRHLWRFEGGIEVAASAAPEFLGVAENVNPEEAFVASLSSCHMLTFLAIASRKRIVVDSYVDHASGLLEKNAAGKLAITRVLLRPQVRFRADSQPSQQELTRMHEIAHGECFIANSVTTQVEIDDSGKHGRTITAESLGQS